MCATISTALNWIFFSIVITFNDLCCQSANAIVIIVVTFTLITVLMKHKMKWIRADCNNITCNCNPSHIHITLSVYVREKTRFLLRKPVAFVMSNCIFTLTSLIYCFTLIFKQRANILDFSAAVIIKDISFV